MDMSNPKVAPVGDNGSFNRQDRHNQTHCCVFKSSHMLFVRAKLVT